MAAEARAAPQRFHPPGHLLTTAADAARGTADRNAHVAGPEHLGDAELVERARRGDSAAFEALVRRYLRAAYAVALAQTGDPADAEDASQEAFLTALERLDACRRPDRFRAWLLQIVRNQALMIRRRDRVRATSPLEHAHGVATPGTPDRDAERAQLRDRLVEALAALPAVQREVVLLHDLEGWRHREIADELGMPEGTVRSHLFFARRALRARLGSNVIVEGAGGTGPD